MALVLTPAIFCCPASTVPILSEVVEHLHRPPNVLHARYIKYYPDKPAIPWELFELHLQTNDYILRRHQVSGAIGVPHWIPGRSEPEIKARIDHIRWTYTPEDRAVISYDPIALGIEVDTNNPAIEADQLALLEINNLLNLGITYADRGGIKVEGHDFSGANRSDGHTVAGTFLTSDGTTLQGANLLLKLVDHRFSTPREFQWEIAYSGELAPEDFPVYPAEMQYVARKPDGSRKQLEGVRFIEVRSAAPLPPEAFHPHAILGTNISFLYAVQSQGRLLYTNALGQLAYKASESSLDRILDRQKSIQRIFPVLTVVILIVATFLYFYRRGCRAAN
ncbi:MAG: hypothetical protein KF833_08070 [Verrucomicrobiae bacterium]|nr:hypothetical protein [Verrucomicrobiae bacterium]